MKYKSIKTEAEKVLHIKVPQNGVDMLSAPSIVDDNCLCLCQNASFQNGRITTRKGILSNSENVLDVSEFDGGVSYDYMMTDTVFYIDEKPFQIAYSNIEYDVSNRFCQVFLIGTDASVTSAGYIHFQRLDDTSFYVPDNICFYTGKPQNGGGLFALVSLKNIENDANAGAVVYEINASLDSWHRATGYYIPTVYINGRGNRYKFAEQSGQVYDGTPRTLEAMNILNGSFYAYYSSDGYSSSFKLPFSNICDSNVICRIYTALDSYTEWCVIAGETSVSNAFFSTEVTMNVDREKGAVYFTVESGEFSVPLMSICKENNIRIMAESPTNADINTVATAKCMTVSGEDIYFSGCNDNNRIYYTSYENPLYFPQIPDNTVGSADSAITALATDRGRLLAFKQSAVYRVNIKFKKALNTTALLLDNGAVFYGVNTLTADTITELYGSTYRNTVGFINGRCIWFDGEKIMLLSKSGGDIYDISKEILPFLIELSEDERDMAFGFCKGNNYILLLGSKAVIIEFKGSGLGGDTAGIGRFIWKLPTDLNLLGALKTGERTVFLCKTALSDICYTAYLSGGSDTVIKKENGEFKTVSYDIETAIKLKDYSFGSLSFKRRIKYIWLRISAEKSVQIKVLTEAGNSDFTLTGNDLSGGKESTVRLITDIYGAETLSLLFEASKGITIGECDIYYIES